MAVPRSAAEMEAFERGLPLDAGKELWARRQLDLAGLRVGDTGYDAMLRFARQGVAAFRIGEMIGLDRETNRRLWEIGKREEERRQRAYIGIDQAMEGGEPKAVVMNQSAGYSWAPVVAMRGNVPEPVVTVPPQAVSGRGGMLDLAPSDTVAPAAHKPFDRVLDID